MLHHLLFAKALRDGTGREFDEAMSKMATGWTLFGGMFALTMGMYGDDVIVNGSGPQELSARRRQEDKGVAPYSISIKDENGNYVNIPFSRLDPLSGILAISADMANVIKNMPEDEGSAKAIEQMMMAGVLATAQYAGNLHFSSRCIRIVSSCWQSLWECNVIQLIIFQSLQEKKLVMLQ